MTKLKSSYGAERLLGENPSKELLEAMGAAMMKHYGITPEDVARYAPKSEENEND